MSAPDPAQVPFPFPTVAYRDRCVVLIDQTLLPERFAWRECRQIDELCQAIRVLAVRGAPALGIAAAYGLVLSWEISCTADLAVGPALEQLRRDAETLAATRPTAVNLFWALERMTGLAGDSVAVAQSPAEVGERLRREADRILAEDIATCRTLGRAGAELLPDEAAVLTHCNAGGLATGGYGTALGVVYAAQEMGKQVQVFADETRPLLQGARLTAWELVTRGIPVTLVCDSAAATLLRDGRIDAVVTGADRVVRNGDTANKIGTYPLALLAREHGVPFYIAAPASTFDPRTPSGQGIVVEQRDHAEVTGFRAQRAAPDGAEAFNPAFDVTPAELISGFVTELGVLRSPYEQTLGPILAAAGQKPGPPVT